MGKVPDEVVLTCTITPFERYLDKYIVSKSLCLRLKFIWNITYIFIYFKISNMLAWGMDKYL